MEKGCGSRDFALLSRAMSHADVTYRFAWKRAVSEVDKAAWDALALPLQTPFMEWDWLRLLETSHSAAPAAGWTPRHLTVWSGDRLVAAAPLYIKPHSEGEFIFDYPWAEVAHRIGAAYFPKLVGMTPFTPVSGYRFLVAPDQDEGVLTEVMVREIDRYCRRNGLSGAGFLFADGKWRRRMRRLGYCEWLHAGFMWKNRGYQSFDDFLSVFKSNQRRNIRRERRDIMAEGIRMRVLAGEQAAGMPRLMHGYYTRTNQRFGPWGCQYLTPEFFERLHEAYGHRLMFVIAQDHRRHGPPVGMAMFVVKGPRLYGRYWGSIDSPHALHFETCYYTPIEWAIANGIRYYDPGIGGGHKIRRGFEASSTFSLHWFTDPRMRRLMACNIDAVNLEERAQIDATNAAVPFHLAPGENPGGGPARGRMED